MFLDLIQTDIIHSPNPNPTLADTCSMLAHESYGVPTREGITAATRTPLTAIPGGDSVAREGAPVGDSLNDE